MAFYESSEIITAIAGEAVSQWDVVLVKTADKNVFAVDDVDNAGIVGVAQEAGVVGSSIPVCIGGVSKVNAAATVTLGAKLASNTSGGAINLSASSRMIGIALTAGVSGDVIPAIIQVGEIKA